MTRLRRYGEATFSVAALLVAAVLFYLTVEQALLQWEYRTPFPYWDMFSVIGFLDRKPWPDIIDLYSFIDNEHRPIVSFLFYLLDRSIYGYSGEFLYRAMFLANACIILSLSGVVLIRHGLGLASNVLVVAIVSYLLFSLFNFENLTWQKQVHEISGLAFLSFGILGAALVTTKHDKERNPPKDAAFALLAGLGCLAATYSFGFGLAAWPAVLIHAALTRWRLLPLLIFGLVASFAVITYALSYSVLRHHTHPFEALQQPLQMTGYVLRVVGAPLSSMFGSSQSALVLTTALIPFAGIVFGLCCVARLYLTPGASMNRSQRIVAMHASMLIIAAIGMAIMLALGRLTVSHSEVASRYFVVGSLFWCGLLVLVSTTLRRDAVRAALLIFGISTVMIGYATAGPGQQTLRARDQNMYIAGVMASSRLHYWPQVPALYFSGPRLFELWHKPRPPFPSFAEREPFNWLGVNLSDLPQVASFSQCLGRVDGIHAVPGAPEVSMVYGWAFIAASETRLRWVVITDPANRGIGVGRTALLRPDVRAHFAARAVNENPDDQYVSGFQIAAVTQSSKRILVWGIDTAGRACKLTGVDPAQAN